MPEQQQKCQCDNCWYRYKPRMPFSKQPDGTWLYRKWCCKRFLYMDIEDNVRYIYKQMNTAPPEQTTLVPVGMDAIFTGQFGVQYMRVKDVKHCDTFLHWKIAAHILLYG